MIIHTQPPQCTKIMKMAYAEIFLAVIFLLIFLYFCHKSHLARTEPGKRTLLELLLNLHRAQEWMVEVLEQSRCTFAVKGPWFSSINLLITSDPANVHYIFSKNFVNFPKGPKFKQMFDILGDGLINADSDLWMLQRKVAHSFLTNPRFNRFLEKTVHRKVEILISILEHANEQELVLDLQDLFQRFTFDTILILATGQDPGSLSIDFPFIPFSKALAVAEEAIFYRHLVPESIWRLQRWLGIGMEKKMKYASEALDDFTYKVIAGKRDELEKKGTVGHSNTNSDKEEGFDLLTLFISEYKDAHGFTSSEKFLRDMILNFIIAGRDTVSVALSWFFWLLSKYPQVETNIREELQGTRKQGNGDENKLETKEISKLVYLHGALSETMRLYPPVPLEHKYPLRPDVLPSGHQVNPSMEIIFNLFAMARTKSIWGDDCTEFKPNRWISERGMIKHEPSYKFLAFNAGPRTCLGKGIAFTQMKAVASAIIDNYHFQVVEGHSVVPDLSIILHMKYGLKVKVTKQSN